MLREILAESAVGSVGRTGKADAEKFVQENPDIVKKFKKIVSQMGGKAVASQLLNMKLFGKTVSDKDSLTPNYKIQKDPAGE